jgi:hypothetical protein
VASIAGVFAAGFLFFPGAIVGGELRNGRFFWTCAFEVFEAVAVSLSARQCFVLSIVGPTM